MKKFNLFYRLEVQLTASYLFIDNATFSLKEINLGQNAVVIESPLTMIAEIKRDSGETFNSANITVYNLNPETRHHISKPRYVTSHFTSVVLYAGYNKNNLTRIFTGNLLQAYSVKVGTNIETRILANEGIFAANNSYIATTYNKGFTFGDFLQESIKALLNFKTPDGMTNSDLQEGAIGNVGQDRVFSRGVAINGNTFVLLNKYFKHQVFIDNQFINVLSANDVFPGLVPLISSDTGLLNTPVIQNNFLTLETLFEPQLVIGQVIEVKDFTFPNCDGQWKIIGMTHNLTISEGMASSGITKLQLFLGNAIFNIVNAPS